MVRPRNGKWVADIKVGNRPRVRKSFVCKAEAERFEATTRTQLQAEALSSESNTMTPTAKGDTVGKWLPLIATDIWGDYSRVVNMTTIIKTWIEYLGANTLLADIRTAHVERFVMEKKRQGKANSTINQFTTRLSKMLKKAKRLDLIHTMPEIVSAGKAGQRKRFLKDSEAQRLIKAFPPYYQLFVTFLLFTGARLGEAEGIVWNDVDEDTLTFKDTKNGSDRVLPLSTQVKHVLNTLRTEGDVKPTQLVFDGYCRSTFRRRWKDAKLAAGLADDADVVPHVLRHTCASRLIKANVNIVTVQRFLGHSDIQMTMRYVHLDMSTMTTAADALSAL